MLIQLQYLRAIAALLVVYFHVILQLQKVDPDAYLGSLVFGESGVDLFFVLSGFVMWVTTSGKPVSPLQFFSKRLRRILPLYWSATLVAALVAFVVPSILRSTVFDPQHLAASLFFIPWINPADPLGTMIAPVIVPGWTLNYEMYFYFMFGILLLLPRFIRLPVLVAVFCLIAFLCHSLSPSSTAGRFYGNLVVFEFLGGVVIGHLYTSNRRLGFLPALAAIVLGFIAIIAFDYGKLPVDRLFAMGLPAAAVLYGMVSIDFARYRPLPWLRYFGDASYSIYITHIFVLAGARMIYGHMPEVVRNQVVFVLLTGGMAVVVGVLVHAVFEAPIDRYLNGKKPKAKIAIDQKLPAAAE